MTQEQTYFNHSKIRELFAKALPEETSLYGRAAEIRYTYLPKPHLKALRPDNMLVVGIRGSGKSFWWAALQKKEHRASLGELIGLDENTIVSVGFGETASITDYPSKDTILNLIKKFDGRKLWRTVVLQHVGKNILPEEFKSLQKWNDRVIWLEENPEEIERCFITADNALDKEKKYHVILFDALDRTADDWQTMNQLVRGLLQTALELRSFKRLRLKIFIRPDQIEAPEVTAFPDASKIISQKTELFWPRNELYGLLWQYLANEPELGHFFREGSRSLLNVEWKEIKEVWKIPEPLRDEVDQRKTFHAITGPWMGRDRRRGFPYTWLINHLGDARQEVSPRSFLAALRHAATDEVRKDFSYALHYESIKRGVQKASEIRVTEMQEDYPWVQDLMKALAGKVSVPCNAAEIEQIWKKNKVLEELEKNIQKQNVRLPPTHIKEGAAGVLEDIQKIGLIERMSDNRINLPDVYRVGYGVGRRGGVKPVARRPDIR